MRRTFTFPSISRILGVFPGAASPLAAGGAGHDAVCLYRGRILGGTFLATLTSWVPLFPGYFAEKGVGVQVFAAVETIPHQKSVPGFRPASRLQWRLPGDEPRQGVTAVESSAQGALDVDCQTGTEAY
jgi:hypothetical protein